MNGLRVSNLRVAFSGNSVLTDVSFNVGPGELVGVIGPNGAGKSTLLRALAGLIPSTGEITIGERNLAAIPLADRARELAYLPQEGDVAWPLDVRSVVALGRLPHRGAFEGARPDDEAIVAQAMREADVMHLADRDVTQLSGGERSRVLLARALAQQTQLFLADEPAAGLDLAHQLDLFTMLQSKCTVGGLVLASLHELDLAARCSRLLLLSNGRLVADGTPRDVLTAATLADVYRVHADIDASSDSLHIRVLGRMNVKPSDV